MTRGEPMSSKKRKRKFRKREEKKTVVAAAEGHPSVWQGRVVDRICFAHLLLPGLLLPGIVDSEKL